MNKSRDKHKCSILLVDDEPLTLTSYQALLKADGYNNILCANDGQEAKDLLETYEFSLVLLDLWMPELNGRQLLEIIATDYPQTAAIIITASNEAETAVECMKSGAFDFITKPIDRTRLLNVVRHALEITELKQENSILSKGFFSQDLKRPQHFQQIITKDPRMLAIFRYIESIAVTNQPVLITGETGTGKQLIAEAIHACSQLPGELVSVNVAGLDDTAFSDTLFGHRKGAFTGANSDRKGLIVKADQGTLFLDEIGDLKLNSQIKLLRLLQEKEYYPLGSDCVQTANTRIVTATNRDLRSLIGDGTFRKDLFFRLHLHHIDIPSLRERTGDIDALLRFFAQACAEELDIPVPEVPDQLPELLESYAFPGNIREMQSLVFDAITCPPFGKLSLDYFTKKLKLKLKSGRTGIHPPSTAAANELIDSLSSAEEPTVITLQEAEQLLIDNALKKADGNLTHAAELLGISRVTLYRRLRDRKKLAATTPGVDISAF